MVIGLTVINHTESGSERDISGKGDDLEALAANILTYKPRIVAFNDKHTGKSRFKKFQIFLSHSKHDEDGDRIAQKVRNYINENPTLDTFYDVQDIPAGMLWEEAIYTFVRDCIMMVVYTDSYSSRDWCRREVLEAKRNGVPILILDCLRYGDERAFPYLGNVPVVRVDPDNVQQIPQATGQLIDETFKILHWLCSTEGLRVAHPDAVFINRAPELLSAVVLQNDSSSKPMRFVYPGPPLNVVESELFNELFPHVEIYSIKVWMMNRTSYE